MRAAALLALVAACATGCQAPGSLAAARAYYAGDPAGAQQQLEAQLASDEEGRALYLNELGVLALERRDLPEAQRLFEEAFHRMGAFDSDGLDATGAILGAEGSKEWRGDPYERAMNSWYLGLTYWLLGVHDNALACFKNSIFVDSSRGEDRFDCDFAPALFLEGLAYRAIGEREMARSSLTTAHELAPDCPALDPARPGNVVVVVDVGRGPTKTNAGEHGELTRFVEHPERPASIEVLVDGAPAGTTAVAGSVYFQATTRGGRDFDAILKTKSAVKSGSAAAGTAALLLADDVSKKRQAGMVAVGAALLLTSLAIRAEADTRHWTSLPNEVQLARLELPPGVHQIEIRPGAGWRVAGPIVQTVEVPPEGDALVYQRVLR